MKPASPITLILSTCEKNAHSISDVITQNGYSVCPVKMESWFNNPSKYITNMYVFVLDDQHFQQKAQSSLLKIDKIPTPSLLCCSNKLLRHDIIELYDDFVEWPCSIQEFLLRLRNLHPRKKEEINPTPFKNIENTWVKLNLVGKSPSLNLALDTVEKSSQYDAPVLIEGETGSGKENFARAIHYLSNRCNHPFIPVNCGSLPENLVENELFGHEKGAYTDAKTDRLGLIAEANGGTLFLDEIESLSPQAQATILRFTQNQEYKPLGSKITKKANVRILAASNIALNDLVSQKQFRIDLMYRLNVLYIKVPPLRERVTDIRLLAEHFINKLRVKYQQPDKRFHPNTLSWMESYHWPGNVRELENFIHREFILSDGPFLSERYLNDKPFFQSCRRKILERRQGINCDLPFSEAKHKIIDQFEHHYLEKLINQANGNVTLAANIAQKERRAIGKLLKKHGIDKGQYVK